MRTALCLLVLSLLTGCDAAGTTCGRGRCNVGQTCISIFGAGRKNQGWRDEQWPRVDNEWWCVRDCPGGKSCTGECLQDPADDEVVVCAVDHADLSFYSAGRSCLCPVAGGVCPPGELVANVEIIDSCNKDGAVLMSCVSGVDCAIGARRSGETLPGARLQGTDPTMAFSYCPGNPENKLGPKLPDGVPIRVWVDLDTCY